MHLQSYFLISLRYLQSARKNSTIAAMIKISFLGIFIASFSLALIISITKGFEQATYKKMQSIYPQIIIDAHGQELDYEKMKLVLDDPKYQIIHHAPQSSIQALCNSLESDEIPSVIHLKGVNPQLEPYVTPIETMILPKNQNHVLEKLLSSNQVIIGKQLAEKLYASTGSQLSIIYTTEKDLSTQLNFNQHKVIVSGIFDTGIDEFDNYFVYCSQNLFNQLFPNHGITQIYITADQKSDESKVIANLTKRLQINVYSWKKLYASLVSALELEKYAMFLILLLILLVASSNIISLLFMQITQKKRDIALLLMFGLPLQKVKAIFLSLSMSIAATATLAGLFCAYIMGIFLENYRWIKLPDNAYYTTHLPILMESSSFLLIFFLVLIISFFASVIPLKNIKMKNIVTTLRHET